MPDGAAQNFLNIHFALADPLPADTVEILAVNNAAENAFALSLVTVDIIEGGSGIKAFIVADTDAFRGFAEGGHRFAEQFITEIFRAVIRQRNLQFTISIGTGAAHILKPVIVLIARLFKQGGDKAADFRQRDMTIFFAQGVVIEPAEYVFLYTGC